MNQELVNLKSTMPLILKKGCIALILVVADESIKIDYATRPC